MSKDRAADVRVERAAVVAVEHSIITMTDLTVAHPAVDWGIDLLAFQPDPLTVAGVQVKGASSGLTVWQKYATQNVIIAHVLDPLGDDPTVCLFTGAEAWRLPLEYVERGGRATDHDPDGGGTYRWASVTRLLCEILLDRRATPERWNALFQSVTG